MSAPSTEIAAPASALVSVIVRSMDRPSLPAALASIAVQDHPTVDVLVVDARGSGHGPVPARAGAHPVRLLSLGRPLPRSQAANAGLDAAAGRWTIFLDDDDVFLPGHLSRLVAALCARPDAVAAYADVDYGRMGSEGWQTEHLFAADFDPLRLRFENFLPLHAVLVDRGTEALRRCRFDETLDLFEDWDWWLQLTRLGAFVRVPGVSARYVAADKGSSGVFADSQATTQARHQLLHKWLALDTPDQRLALLQALQTHYRDAHQAADQLQLGQRTEQNLRAIIDAREHDLAQAEVQHSNLQQQVSARSAEIDDYHAQMDSLKQVLAARDGEIGDALQQVDNLRRTVSARDQEIADGLQQIQALQGILSARESELAESLAQIHGLQDVVAAREREIADSLIQIRDLRDILAARDDEIAHLRPAADAGSPNAPHD